MAVYERTYRPYPGPLTPEWSRFLVLPRYALRDVFRSRLVLVFFSGCFLFPLVTAVLLYLKHNLGALALLDLKAASVVTIDAAYYSAFLAFQGLGLGFLLTLLVGPPLVSADLRNGALPLLLSRPLSRAEYVLGKFSVLALLLSAITWAPGLLLVLLQAYLEGPAWLAAHARLPFALFAGSWIWIVTLSLLSLAVSAWVKWAHVARGVLVGVLMVASAFGVFLNELLDTRWGFLVNVGALVRSLWLWLFGLEDARRLPPLAAGLALLLLAGACLLLIARRVRPVEVVR